jgi:hypothetical protein
LRASCSAVFAPLTILERFFVSGQKRLDGAKILFDGGVLRQLLLFPGSKGDDVTHFRASPLIAP